MAVLRQGQHFLAVGPAQDSHSPGSARVAVAELRLLLLLSSSAQLPRGATLFQSHGNRCRAAADTTVSSTVQAKSS